jgi:hypothetical protein
MRRSDPSDVIRNYRPDSDLYVIYTVGQKFAN